MPFCEDVRLRAVRVNTEIPGFISNRVWFALLREMLHLVDVGAVDPLELDDVVQTTLRADILGDDHAPEEISPFPYKFYYWIDPCGVQWEMEQGRPVDQALKGIVG